MFTPNDPTRLILLETDTGTSPSKFHHLRLTTVPLKVEKVVPIDAAYHVNDDTPRIGSIANIKLEWKMPKHCLLGSETVIKL